MSTAPGNLQGQGGQEGHDNREYYSDTTAGQQAADSSLGQLVGRLTEDFSTLVRQEVSLAKAELKESAVAAGKGAGSLGGAAYAAGTAVLLLSFALASALADWWENWALGFLAVGVLWAIVAAVLYFMGRSQLEEVKGMPQTQDTVQRIPDALKPNEETTR